MHRPPRSPVLPLLAVAAVGVAWFLLAPPATAQALATPEAEPNDAPWQATPLEPGQSGVASSTGLNDTDFWRLEPPGSGRIWLFLSIQSGGGFCLQLNITDAAGRPIESTRLQNFDYEVSFKFLTPGNTSVLVEVCHTESVFDYHLYYQFSIGEDDPFCSHESEWNGAPWAAETVHPGSVEHGCSNAEYRDVDYWNVSSGQDLWAVAVVDTTGRVNTTVVGPAGPVETVPTGDPSIFYFAVPMGVPTYLRVESLVGLAEYSFRVEVAPALDGLRVGPGETEPNDVPEHPTVLSFNGTFEGLLDARVDPSDWYLVLAPPGAVVQVRLDGHFDHDHGAVTSAWPAGAFADVHYGDARVGVDAYAALMVARNDTPLLFRLNATSLRHHYNITLNITRAPVLAGPEVELADLVSVVQASTAVTPAGLSGWNLGGYNLRNGYGVLFGASMCARSALTVPLGGVAVHAGATLAPESGSFVGFVVSRSAALTVGAGGAACFDAIETSGYGWLADATHPFFFSGQLAGPARAVIEEVNRSHREGAASTLALWSVLHNLTEEDAHQWGALETHIAQARNILDTAGVVAPLNAPPPGNAPPALALAAALSAAALGVVAAAAHRRRERVRRVRAARAWHASSDLPAALRPRPIPACPACGAPTPPAAGTCSWCGSPV